MGSRLNKLRAAVLGANDGIVSVAGLVVGVAGATSSRTIILTAGIAGVLSGALSMAAGEYVSVSSQRDTERALLKKEMYELEHYPKEELAELAAIYEEKGLSAATAKKAAMELSAHDVHAAHFDAELGIDPQELTNPLAAAIASAISFVIGSALPILTITLLPNPTRIVGTFIIVLIALAITGTLGALFGGAKPLRAAWRVVFGGALAMIVTYGIGHLFHISAS